MGVLLLEFGELVEVAAQFLVGVVGDTVDAVLGVDDPPVVGLGITLFRLVGQEAAAVLVDVAERVVDVGQLIGAAVVDDVADAVSAFLDAPLGEVGDAQVLVVGAGGGLFTGAGGAVDGAVDRFGGTVLVQPVETERVAPACRDGGSPVRWCEGVGAVVVGDGGVPQFVDPTVVGKFEGDLPVVDGCVGCVVEGDQTAVPGVPACGFRVGDREVGGVGVLCQGPGRGQSEGRRQQKGGRHRGQGVGTSCSHVVRSPGRGSAFGGTPTSGIKLLGNLTNDLDPRQRLPPIFFVELANRSRASAPGPSARVG